MKMKHYADGRNHAKPCKIKEGDTVLVKLDHKENKLSPTFRPKPYVVTSRKGSMVTANSGDHNITRNSSYFKQIPHTPILVQEGDEEHIPDVNTKVENQNTETNIPNKSATPQQPKAPPDPPPSSESGPVVQKRSTRATRMPEHLKDYILK